MHRRLLPICLLLLVSLASPLYAQTTTPATITEFRFLRLPGTGDPTTIAPLDTISTTIGPTSNCGILKSTLKPPATGVPVNPKLFVVDDPTDTAVPATKACVLGFPQNIPTGTYQWAGIWFSPSCTDSNGQTQANCLSPRTVGTPNFSIANLVTKPPAPTGLAIPSP